MTKQIDEPPNPTTLIPVLSGPEDLPTDFDIAFPDESADLDPFADPEPTAADRARWISEGRTYELPYNETYYGGFNGSKVEDPEDYIRLRYHPVHYGDIIVGHHSSYRIDSKIDFDDNRMAWAAFDTQAGFHRKLVIESAVYTEASGARRKELYLRLAAEMERSAGLEERMYNPHPGIDHIDIPTDIFEIMGPNGTHLCTVTTLQVFDLGNLLYTEYSESSPLLDTDHHPIANKETVNPKVRLRFVLELARAVEALHAIGIVHGTEDINTRTATFTDRNQALLRRDTIEMLSDDDERKTIEPRRLPVPIETPDPDAAVVPRYLAYTKGEILGVHMRRYFIHQPTPLLSAPLPTSADPAPTKADDIAALAIIFGIVLTDHGVYYGIPGADAPDPEFIREQLTEIRCWECGNPDAGEDGWVVRRWYSEEEVEVLVRVLCGMLEVEEGRRVGIGEVVRGLPERWGEVGYEC